MIGPNFFCHVIAFRLFETIVTTGPHRFMLQSLSSVEETKRLVGKGRGGFLYSLKIVSTESISLSDENSIINQKQPSVHIHL